MIWLHAFGQRMCRSFAHLCLLGVIMVQLQVTIPAEYFGLLWYVDAAGEGQVVLGGGEMPGLNIVEITHEPDSPPLVEVPDLAMPNFVMPEMAMPAEEPTSIEV